MAIFLLTSSCVSIETTDEAVLSFDVLVCFIEVEQQDAFEGNVDG